jgi:hypothetical protein
MPLRDPKPESHVVAAAAAQQSTMNILNAARPRTPQLETPPKASSGSFIEDVELWVKKYLNLADEALQSPAEPRGEDEESAA